MIPAHKNLTHPPGQIQSLIVGAEHMSDKGYQLGTLEGYEESVKKRGLYLRDVIKRIQGEEATQPSTSAETRLNSLVGALTAYCEDVGDCLDRQGEYISTTIRAIIKEHTNI